MHFNLYKINAASCLVYFLTDHMYIAEMCKRTKICLTVLKNLALSDTELTNITLINCLHSVMDTALYVFHI